MLGHTLLWSVIKTFRPTKVWVIFCSLCGVFRIVWLWRAGSSSVRYCLLWKSLCCTFQPLSLLDWCASFCQILRMLLLFYINSDFWKSNYNDGLMNWCVIHLWWHLLHKAIFYYWDSLIQNQLKINTFRDWAYSKSYYYICISQRFLETQFLFWYSKIVKLPGWSYLLNLICSNFQLHTGLIIRWTVVCSWVPTNKC